MVNNVLQVAQRFSSFAISHPCPPLSIIDLPSFANRFGYSLSRMLVTVFSGASWFGNVFEHLSHLNDIDLPHILNSVDPDSVAFSEIQVGKLPK